MNRPNAIEILHRFIEHAPAEPPTPPVADLSGWTGPDATVCSHCAGRILARGCDLKSYCPTPVWDKDIVCDLADTHKGT
jgi:hypothetical protein